MIPVILAALENEVLRNPKPSLVDRSVLELGADKLFPPDIYVDRALLRTRVGYDDVCEAGGNRGGNKSLWDGIPDSDLELVAEAKARIKELQEEADTLEEAYRSYQQRAVHSTISHMLPPRALSPQQPHPSHSPDAPLRKHDPLRSRTHSAHKPKISHRPLSPQSAQPLPYGTRKTLSSSQPRVTFSEDLNQPEATCYADHSLSSLTQPLSLKNGHITSESSAPPKHPSSTSQPSFKENLQREITEGNMTDKFLVLFNEKYLNIQISLDLYISVSEQISSSAVLSNIKSFLLLEAVASVVTFPRLSSDRQLSPALLNEAATSGDLFSELSPPCSPQLRSTARDQSRYHLA